MEATVDLPVAMEPVRPMRSIFWGGPGKQGEWFGNMVGRMEGGGEVESGRGGGWGRVEIDSRDLSIDLLSRSQRLLVLKWLDVMETAFSVSMDNPLKQI